MKTQNLNTVDFIRLKSIFSRKTTKLIFTYVAALFFLQDINAQSSKAIQSKLQKVTVYLQGAHLYYNETVNLQSGNNEITFEGISPYVNIASLQASSKSAIVMDVKHNLKYKEKEVVTKKYDKDIERVLDSLEELSFEIKDVDNKFKVLAQEKSMLLNNRIMKGEPLKDSLVLIKEGMIFLKEKLNSIYEQELKLERAKAKLTKQKSKLETRHNTLTLLQNGTINESVANAQPIHQIIVTLFSELPATAVPVSFNYFVSNANWQPVYNLQATSAKNSLELKYFANVTQSTGLAWNNVPLTLSTSNPAESNTKPELSPWYLSYQQYIREYNKNITQSNAYRPLESQTISKDGATEYSVKKNEADYLKNYVQMSENMIRTEYEIKLNYNITADNKPHKVLINQKDTPMSMEFAAVPKICTDAYLLARVTGWEDMNIIPGNARLYFDNTFVGEMYLDASTTDDTLDINLGRDKSIAITRKKVKEDFKKKVLSDEKVETRTIEIMVRNTKNVPIELVIEDQIPVVSGTNEIKVALVSSDGATLDASTGKLTWNKKLKVKESEKITFTYEIKYPKDKVVAGL